jgi:hypothetical protein
MTRSTDPGWIRLAGRVYAAALWLFPAALRQAHGDEMRQAFRDRCREVARGERSAFRVLALELLPDTLRSAGAEQVSATFGDMRPRQYWALGLLCCAAVGLLCKDQLNRYTLDLAFQAKYALRNIHEARDMAQREARVRSLAESLAASDSLESKALGAYLYRSIYTGRDSMYVYGEDRGGSPFIGKLTADGDRATAAAASALGAHPDAYPLAVAVQACELAVIGCNRATAIRQLVARDPDNAFGWSLAFKWAAQHGDQQAMGDALKRMASSHHFENYQGPLTRDLIVAAQKQAPGDTDFLAVIATQARTAAYLARADDFRHDVRFNCTRRTTTEPAGSPRWLETHPESQEDCLRIAGLLSRSTDLMSARWGWRRIHAQETDPLLRAQELQRLRDTQWMWEQTVPGSSREADGSWQDWKEAEWNQWAAAWNAGDGEIPAARRWLAARGLSAVAPAEFKTRGY